jgi:uncharacterized protein YdeI (YjbR/CyaY-like superfamily)
MDADSFPKVEITAEEDLWSWLDAHHDQSNSVWLVTWKAAHRDRYISNNQVLDALIAYGWVDGRKLKLDDARVMQLISPRKQKAWAQSYRDRAERLEREGRMKPPGRAALEEARQSGVFDSMQSVDALEEPSDLVEALDEVGGYGWWVTAAPSYRRNVLRWIASAKGRDTRLKRIHAVSEHAAQGKKVPNY